MSTPETAADASQCLRQCTYQNGKFVPEAANNRLSERVRKGLYQGNMKIAGEGNFRRAAVVLSWRVSEELVVQAG
jgi:hypothetical protein